MTMVAESVWDKDYNVNCTAYFPCTCGSEGLVTMHVEGGDDYPASVDIGFLNCAAKYCDSRMTWCDRLRYAWQCLRGRPYTDMVMLNPDTAASFATAILSACENIE